PEHKARKHRCAGPQRYASKSCRRTRQLSKERHKGALRRSHVRIHQDAYGLASAHGAQQPTGEVVFMKNTVSVQAADSVDQAVYSRVVEPPDDHTHRVAHQGVIEARKLPRSKMAGHDQYAFAFVASCQIALQTLIPEK